MYFLNFPAPLLKDSYLNTVVSVGHSIAHKYLRKHLLSLNKRNEKQNETDI